MLRHLRVNLDRFRNLLLVLIAVGTGIHLPKFGPYLEPLITPLVIFLVYSSVRGWEFGEGESNSYGVLVVLSLCFSYLLLPAVGIQVADALLTDNAAFGMAIVLSVPTTAGSAIVWTRLSNSNVHDNHLARLAPACAAGDTVRSLTACRVAGSAPDINHLRQSVANHRRGRAR